MIIRIPQDAQSIIATLNENGYEAYVVGGCVRDSLLGRDPEDWDITTSARPEDIKRLFTRTIDTGIQHGTVTVRMHGNSYEVTTYRIDGEYEDNRHPKNVTYTMELKEDLRRRDFTINAMAYNPTEGLVDIFGGRNDLDDRMIRCVGNASDRFDEDALRTLRAVRFAGQLGFDIEEDTYDAIKTHAGNVASISAERIRVELTKLIESGGADRLKLIVDTGLADVIFPELVTMFDTPQNNPHHKYNVGDHTLKVIEDIHRQCDGAFRENDAKGFRILCLSGLLHDVAKPVKRTTDEDGIDHFYGHPQAGEDMAKDILTRLKFDNYTINMVKNLVLNHDYRYNGQKKSLRRFVSKAGHDIMPYLFILMEADINGQSEYYRKEKKEMLYLMKEDYKNIVEESNAVTIKELEINGVTLMDMGVPKGKMIGDILNMLLEAVIEDPGLNEKNTLEEMAKNIFSKKM